jgi:hypothetical protein
MNWPVPASWLPVEKSRVTPSDPAFSREDCESSWPANDRWSQARQRKVGGLHQGGGLPAHSSKTGGMRPAKAWIAWNRLPLMVIARLKVASMRVYECSMNGRFGPAPSPGG